jgi:hypothetical protein
MKFNPITRRLYTDDLRFLKRLSCPSPPRWVTLTDENSEGDQTCSVCDRLIVDLSVHTDDSIAAVLAADPDTCVKVTLDHPNITAVHHEPGV